VPEAPIDENSDLGSGQGDVWAASKVLNVHPIPKSATVQLASQCQLWPCSHGPQARHEATHSRTRSLWLVSYWGLGRHR
jgi:hypothetical protein